MFHPKFKTMKKVKSMIKSTVSSIRATRAKMELIYWFSKCQFLRLRLMLKTGKHIPE
jgi:hypothetical protein